VEHVVRVAVRERRRLVGDALHGARVPEDDHLRGQVEPGRRVLRERIDCAVAQLREVLAAPVVPHPVRGEAVQHRLERHVGHRPEQVERRLGLAEGAHELEPLLRVADVQERHAHGRLALGFGRHELLRRRHRELHDGG